MTVAERPTHLHEMLVKAADLHRADAISEAAAVYEDILKEAPEDPDALHLAGLVTQQRGFPSIALELVSRSLAIRPDYGPAHATLGLALGGLGKHLSAMAEFRRAVDLDPSHVEAWTNLIFAADLDPGTSKEQARAIRRRFDALHVKPLHDAAPPNTNDRDTGRRLTIGYVGNDFRHHSAAMLCWPVISRHDFDRFRVVLFDGSRAYDHVSAKFDALPLTRLPIRGRDDVTVAEMIRFEEVDVLIDLTGFAGGSRTGVFARRPAPVQIQGWSYLSDSTQLSCFDGIFCDSVTVPEGADEGFTERAIRLPAFIAYEPLEAMPEVALPPVERNGYVTFGNLGRAHQINDDVLRVWAEILHRVRDARLLLKHNQYDDENMAFAVADALVARGVPDYRIEMRGGSKPYEHAAAYADVDICLDTWPQNGGVTTLEAAYMGVPTVTLAGDRMGSRKGASIVDHTRGETYHQMYAETVSEYIQEAVRTAHEAAQLTPEWAWPVGRIRQRLIDSPFMIHSEYARACEDAYVDLVKEWAGS